MAGSLREFLTANQSLFFHSTLHCKPQETRHKSLVDISTLSVTLELLRSWSVTVLPYTQSLLKEHFDFSNGVLFQVKQTVQVIAFKKQASNQLIQLTFSYDLATKAQKNFNHLYL